MRYTIDMGLEQKIEAVLFYKAEPMKRTELVKFFSVTDGELSEALASLTSSLSLRGIRMVATDTTVCLVTAPELSECIDEVRKEELKGDIGKAGAETLAIILYRGPLSRIEIDRIRGVNSTFIIRNLLIRGLVERRAHPTDQRSYTYAITPTLLNHLGITSRESLPQFAEVMNALDTFEREENEKEAEETTANPFETL